MTDNNDHLFNNKNKKDVNEYENELNIYSNLKSDNVMTCRIKNNCVKNSYRSEHNYIINKSINMNELNFENISEKVKIEKNDTIEINDEEEINLSRISRETRFTPIQMIKNAKKEIRKKEVVKDSKILDYIFNHTNNESNTLTNLSILVDKNIEDTFETCNDINDQQNFSTIKKRKIPFKTESSNSKIILKKTNDINTLNEVNTNIVTKKDSFLKSFNSKSLNTLSKVDEFLITNRPININININNYTNSMESTYECKENKIKILNKDLMTNFNNETINTEVFDSLSNLDSTIKSKIEINNNFLNTGNNNIKTPTFLKIPRKIVYRITSTNK